MHEEGSHHEIQQRCCCHRQRFFPPKMRARYGVVESDHVLLRSLAMAGLAPEDIDVVVLSHLHFDHAGGVLAAWEEGAPARLAFPRAA